MQLWRGWDHWNRMVEAQRAGPELAIGCKRCGGRMVCRRRLDVRSDALGVRAEVIGVVDGRACLEDGAVLDEEDERVVDATHYRMSCGCVYSAEAVEELNGRAKWVGTN